jgi:molybdopterin-containing oxidoreductase family iron-sulfur binding subunit
MTARDLSTTIDLATLRKRLAATEGRAYWRGLEELAETPEFFAMVTREFPVAASEWGDTFSRRKFLTLMGASLALAGVTGCGDRPVEKIYPYVRAPENIVPGKPLFFATALSLGGIAQGVLVESHMGRPTKVEGNPDHPASLGATDAFTQASVLSLYDPDRSQVITHRGNISTWEEFIRAVQPAIAETREKKGLGLRILTETVTSPTLAAQLNQILRDMPDAVWHQYEPISRDNVRAGARLVFDEDVESIYHFDRAEVVLSLDADFLSSGPGSVRYQRDFMDKRRVREASPTMNRLYAIESTPSPTGAAADHRLPLRASEVASFVRALASRLGIAPTPFNFGDNPLHEAWIAAVADDLRANRGASIVLVGDEQPAHVHAIVHLINAELGNVGKTVTYVEPVEARPVDQAKSLFDLSLALDAEEVDVLLILGGNPVYNAPAGSDFDADLSKAGTTVRLGYYEDETSAACRWHIPAVHELESWGDVRAYEGTVTVQQPLIAPLFGGKSPSELISALFDDTPRSTYDVVRDYWRERHGDDGFETFWQTVVHNGLVPDTASAEATVEARPADELRDHVWNPVATREPTKAGDLEIVFRADSTVYDGRFANNAWLQELPKPLLHLTWDNVASVSAATAERLKLNNGDVVELHYLDRTIEAPVWIALGHADDAVTVQLGFGRTRAGKVGNDVGFNAYKLRSADAPWFDGGLKIVKTEKKHPLACTQSHFSLEGRDMVRWGTLEEYKKDHHSPIKIGGHSEHGEHASLYPPFPNPEYAWGMSIDLNSCTGCGACIVACQAENNISVVGKEQVIAQREMHWLRIDRYYSGDLDNPEVHQQPMLCQHCEQAPCEVVCPVAATTHSSEGLNEMTYNRCVGTRYCSNNCPYKVRRFNFLNYLGDITPLTKMQHNPDVTVRSRGVMEKCTFCVQRINAARITTEVEGVRSGEQKRIQDGDIVTACQSACASQAIVFGDLNDKNSRVSKLKAEPTNYGVLTELNTHPRVTYLARIRNPNPVLAAAEKEHSKGRAVVPVNQFLP